MPKKRRVIAAIADRDADMYLGGGRVDERYHDDDFVEVAGVPFVQVSLKNQHITRLPPFQPTLQTLRLDSCTSLASLAGIERLVRLRSLTLLRLPALDFDAVAAVLAELPQLVELTIGGEALRTLPVLRLPTLVDLTLQLTMDLDLEPIAEIATLKNLHLPETKGTIDFTPLKHLELVDISTTNLGDVDDSLGRLTNVQKLWLRSCKIASLPPTIGKLQKLTALDLRWADISELPDELCECAALVALNISNTRITALPANLGRLSKLHRLDANTKKLKVPESIGDLANLRHVSIPYKHAKVPASFYNLTLESFFGPPAIGEKLTLLKPATPQQDSVWLHEPDRLPDDFGDPLHLDLNLGPDHMDEIPQLSKLPRLASLELCTGNLVDAFRRLAAGSPVLRSINVHDVRTLPDEIGELDQLTTLTFNKHSGDETAPGIEALPESIGRLVRLKNLNLGPHALKRLPDEIGNLTALETFIMWKAAEVRVLPDTIGKLRSLKKLMLFPELEHLPESILDCPIESLTIHGQFGTDCAIDNLPMLGKIHTLKELSLSGLAGLQLADILEAFAGHALETLDLEWAKIDELPPQIGKLTNLRKLVVRSTDITAFPPELRNCTELRHLGLSMFKFPDKKALKAQLPKGRWKLVRINGNDAYVRTP